MTTMLERSARALAVAWYCRPDDDDETKAQAAEQWPGFTAQARAALQAIREPSHDVTKTAGQRALISLDQEQLAEAFTAMIDAILAEDKA